MPILESANERSQVDWMISNLRWWLLVSVALVNIIGALGGFLDLSYLPSQVILLAIATLYNLVVTLLPPYRTLKRAIMPVMTLLIDTVLTIGFVMTSGGLTSPLLFFALFPIFTAALCFPWAISPLTAVVIAAICGFARYFRAPPTSWLDLLPFIVRSLVLLLAALISSLVGRRMKQKVAHARRLEEEAALRKLRVAHEHSRVIFELASTLSATLNYNKVLDTVLEVGEAGMRELGQPDSAHVSMVILFSHNDLRMVASRHLPPRDQNVVFQGKGGVLARALATAEATVTDNPSEDPELGQLIMMYSCQQAIIMPLRAGFENFGAVIFGSPQPDTYTEDHKDLLIAICNQAIVALQNAQLYQSLTEEKERIVAVEEDARRKLSRDLHDGPTQSIAAIAMRLNYARMLLEKNPQQTAEELAWVEELARRTTKEIRHMLFTLRPLILETQGLLAALEQYINKLAEMDATPIHMEAVPKVDQMLEMNVQGVIFYILDEAIGNARKHASAKNIWVRLNIQDSLFVAEVEDDGCGFDVDAVQVSYDKRGSLGMINMHERAELVSGKLTIASALGEGTRVTLTVPLEVR